MDNPAESQRKTPKQSRSKALVDAIFEATTRILPVVGSRNITTKKIAELAGVSIGSLYQYFPNKEALLSAIIDIGMNSKTADIQKKIDEIRGRSIDESVDVIVNFTLEIFLKDRKRISELFMLAPELGKIPRLLQVRQQVVEHLAEEMARQRPGLTQEEYVRVSFIAVNSIMGVVQTMLYDDSQTYSIDELAYELKVMFKSYFNERAK